ncbi:MAG: RNA methyltransferase [FCB group bacterium]|nr:RNA methyltransferase [FCB group bacterium]
MKTIHSSDLTRRIINEAAKLQKKKFRTLNGRSLIEGLLPLEEAARSAYRVHEIFYNPFLLDKPGVRELIAGLQERDQTACYEVGGRELKELSSEVTPQGIVATADQRQFDISDLKGSILVLDQLQDPGNVGTLFRIAHWFGLGGILLMKDCVDASNPKVIRGSMGSFFHIPFITEEELPEALLKDRTLILTKAHAGTGIPEIPKEKPFLLVIGNEARGVSPEFDMYPHLDLSLPRLGGAESLNAAVAAAAILSKILYS